MTESTGPIWTAVSDLKDTVSEIDARTQARIGVVDQRTSVHEAVCAERYSAINLRLNALLFLFVVLAAADVFGWKAALSLAFKAAVP